MKKTKFSVILLLLAFFTAFTAEAKVLGLGIGPKVGMTFNQLVISKGMLDSDNRCGFTGGVTVEYVAPILGLGADGSVMFSHMQTKLPDTGDVVKGNFIEVPLHIKYKFNIPVISSILKPYLFTGPDFAFKLNKKDFMNTKTAQVGWDVGLGLEFIKHLQVGAGYTFGLNDIAPDTYSVADVKVKNNYWTVTLAWLF